VFARQRPAEAHRGVRIVGGEVVDRNRQSVGENLTADVRLGCGAVKSAQNMTLRATVAHGFGRLRNDLTVDQLSARCLGPGFGPGKVIRNGQCFAQSDVHGVILSPRARLQHLACWRQAGADECGEAR
jgi:hypothetical protein